MTYDQYWYGDVRMVRAFREADRLRQERMNTEKWLQGMYFYDALACTLQNVLRKKSDLPMEYPKEPYDVSTKKEIHQEQQSKEEQERLIAKLYMHQLKWSTKNWGGK